MKVYIPDIENKKIRIEHFYVNISFSFEDELDEIYGVWFYSNLMARKYLKEELENDFKLF